MAKGKARKAAQANKAKRKTAAYLAGGGKSRYAAKHRGGGNTGPHGMWLVWRPEGTPGSVTRDDLRIAAEDRQANVAHHEYVENVRRFGLEA